ncbi:hypothetical protein OUZ56_033705 [Daphnia magna]|uniref:Uncharacterized protein n=1 Tax=Daphnia magna TaxID=35525 RepID=A0ABR0BB13_9CRUS|nr:hypothetical protein OUZ56_033705 [Daphnia magna]
MDTPNKDEKRIDSNPISTVKILGPRPSVQFPLSEEGEEVEGEEEEDGCGGGGGVFYRHTGNQTIEIQQHLVS